MILRAEVVESAYAELQKARRDLEKWDQVADRFHEHEKLRQPLLREIESEQARLEEERRRLEQDRLAMENQQAETSSLSAEIDLARLTLDEAEKKVTQRQELEAQTTSAVQRQAEMRAENAALKIEMDALKERIEKLEAAEGAACPLCGQSLTEKHRKSTLEQLNSEGKDKGDRHRANAAALKELDGQVAEFKAAFAALAHAETERLSASTRIAGLTERVESIRKQAGEWDSGGARRLAEVTKLLESQAFAQEARKKLARRDKDLAALGYDAAAHDAARKREVESRPAEAEYRALAEARSALKPLEDEIANVKTDIEKRQEEVRLQQAEHAEAAATLAVSEAQAPDFEAAEQSLFDLQEQENILNQEVGAARQKVNVLDDLRKRKKAFAIEREEISLQTGRYKTLERAFGKDGVPALLIEQALPEIEMKANEILGRLSDDAMHLHFETQTKYKDDKRKDLRETLEIQVSDGAGLRDYEMFSGGESFPGQLCHPAGALGSAGPAQGCPPANAHHRRGLRLTGYPRAAAADPGHQRGQRRFCQDTGHHPPGRTERRLPQPHRGGKRRTRLDGDGDIGGGIYSGEPSPRHADIPLEVSRKKSARRDGGFVFMPNGMRRT